MGNNEKTKIPVEDISPEKMETRKIVMAQGI